MHGHTPPALGLLQRIPRRALTGGDWRERLSRRIGSSYYLKSPLRFEPYESLSIHSRGDQLREKFWRCLSLGLGWDRLVAKLGRASLFQPLDLGLRQD